ncbi:MAG: hypothetical protein JWO78_828 [Micavibrio sp.]|nr:hypothetical protein [Micavibrio sp.]
MQGLKNLFAKAADNKQEDVHVAEVILRALGDAETRMAQGCKLDWDFP